MWNFMIFWIRQTYRIIRRDNVIILPRIMLVKHKVIQKPTSSNLCSEKNFLTHALKRLAPDLQILFPDMAEYCDQRYIYANDEREGSVNNNVKIFL